MSRPYTYHLLDVFTDRPFGGNQLAVFPDGQGLTAETMQLVARELNLSETVFVLPPDESRHTRKVRIFTPGRELPFAGHPTVGTAHCLVATGEIPAPPDGEIDIVLEEEVGPVPVKVRMEGGKPVFAQLAAAQMPEFRDPPASPAAIAGVLGLKEQDLLPADAWPIRAVSCGFPFLFVPVRDRSVLGRVRMRTDRWEQVLSGWWAENIFVFAPDGELPGSDFRARMFGPSIGIVEDPATGSAATGLGGYLGREGRGGRAGRETLRWVVEQGFEMGRPSMLHVEVDLLNGAIAAIRVGGRSVMMGEGTMML